MYWPSATRTRPATAKAICARRSARVLSVVASITPQAAPAKTNPAQGNKVNVVRSPAGFMYHWNQSGRASTIAAVQTTGVSSAAVAATAAYQRTRALVLAPAAQTRPAATIAGPMTLRMSTRNIVTGWLPGLTMNACTRKRSARMKISRPRRQIVRTTAPRLSKVRASRVADSATPSPASHRNSGAAKPPNTRARPNAAEWRSAARVHASAVCHSIIRSTARPRAQSM